MALLVVCFSLIEQMHDAYPTQFVNAPLTLPLVGILQSSFFIEKVIVSYFNQRCNFNFYCVNVENVTTLRSFEKGTF